MKSRLMTGGVKMVVFDIDGKKVLQVQLTLFSA